LRDTEPSWGVESPQPPNRPIARNKPKKLGLIIKAIVLFAIVFPVFIEIGLVAIVIAISGIRTLEIVKITAFCLRTLKIIKIFISIVSRLAIVYIIDIGSRLFILIGNRGAAARRRGRTRSTRPRSLGRFGIAIADRTARRAFSGGAIVIVGRAFSIASGFFPVVFPFIIVIRVATCIGIGFIFGGTRRRAIAVSFWRRWRRWRGRRRRRRSRTAAATTTGRFEIVSSPAAAASGLFLVIRTTIGTPS
jgi:hypothetical protein